MFEGIINFFKNLGKKDQQQGKSKDAAKERLHLVLMQDRANVSADFLDLMKQEIIEVIKKYIDVDENAIDVRLTNKANTDGTTGAPALYANIPIVSIKEEVKSKMARQSSKNEENTQIDNKENEVEQEEIVQVEENNEKTVVQEENNEEIIKEENKQEEVENKEEVKIENKEEVKDQEIENGETSQEKQETENKERATEQFEITNSNQPLN